jgi:hypothetical protein
MLVSSYVNGFGQAFGQAQPASLFEVAQALTARAQRSAAATGFGAALTNFEEFLAASAAGRAASFVDPTKTVFCKVPDKAGLFRLECVANSTNLADRGPARAMQQATDALLNQIPLFQLAGQSLDVKLPGGGTRPVFIDKFPTNPILTIGGGYDGVVGAGTMQFAEPALLLAASLSAPPPSVVPAFTSPTAFTFTQAAGAIAGYFQEVTRNFASLLAAFKERGNKPAATPLVPETVIVPPGAEKSKRPVGAIIGAAAAMIGLTAVGAVSAAKHKPTALYEEQGVPSPAFGRRRHRGRGHYGLRPRGW